MDKVKLGAVGLGRLGKYHAETIANRITNATLATVCSIEENELEWAVTKLGNPKPFSSYAEMLEEDIDGVVLTTPSALHCAQIEMAIDKGLHVFCEKPLGIDLAECTKIGKLLGDHPDKVFMLGFMRRYDPSYQYAYNMIQQGAIGTPILFRGYSVDAVKSIAGALQYASKSAGQFLDMAIHDIDLSRWMLGSEPATVHAIGGCFRFEEFARYNDGDNVSALMQFQNGGMAFFFAGRTAPHGYHVETEIIGTESTLRIASVPQKNFVEILDAHGVRRLCSEDFIERFGEAYVNELQEFVNCIIERRQPVVTVNDGIEATRIAIAATRSFREKRLIHL